MKHRSPAVLAALALAAGTTWVVAAPVRAAAPTTCQGKPVTVVATTTVTAGTEGDDVVAMEPGGWTTFDAKGGNDTVCLALPAEITTDHYGGRDRIGELDAGPGDDAVTNLTPVGTTGISYFAVVLGLGSDTFTGSDVGELVFTDLDERFRDDPDVVDPTLVGQQVDVVSGAATVHSAAPVGAPNSDRITFGSRGGNAVMSGPLGPQGLLDFSAASEPRLEVRSLRRLGVPYSGDVVVDNRARTFTAGGSTLLTWSGDVPTFLLGAPRHLVVMGPAVGFTGTDADEDVSFADVLVGEVDLGGGADNLVVESRNNAFIPRSADGGSGRDHASIDSVCHTELRVTLEQTIACDGRSGPFTGFRDVAVSGSNAMGAATVLVGTDRSERLVAGGQTVVVRGAGGRDEVLVDESWSARVFAGAGGDRVVVNGDDVVVRGQAGGDRLQLFGSARFTTPPDARRQQVALGGAGADVLVGTTGSRDRLIGGPGNDRANGREGRRDYCTAETSLRCERP